MQGSMGELVAWILFFLYTIFIRNRAPLFSIGDILVQLLIIDDLARRHGVSAPSQGRIFVPGTRSLGQSPRSFTSIRD